MKQFITTVLGLITVITAGAQDNLQYLNVTAGGGLHNMNYTLLDGDVKGGPGGTLNLGYSYFFNDRWGVTTGLGVQTAQATGTLSFTTAFDAIDADGDPFELRVRYDDWQERQSALFLDIPLAIQYRHPLSDKNSLLFSAGAKISIPLAASYKVTSGSIITTGYYEQWDVELSDMPQHGFTTNTSRPSGDISMNTSGALMAELGWLHNVSDKLDLYAGGYVSYGISSAANEAGNSIYISDGTYNGMIPSYQAGKVNVVTAGIKAGIRLRLKQNRKKEMSFVAPVITEEEEPAAIVTVEEVAVVEETAPAEQPSAVTPQEPVVSMSDTIAMAQVIADRITMRFPLDSDKPLNDKFNSQFDELARVLLANPSLRVRIMGHTCNLAGRDYNMKVGMKRAEAGKARLTDRGVPDTQIVTESKAFDEPLVPNTCANNRAQNRRITFVIEESVL